MARHNTSRERTAALNKERPALATTPAAPPALQPRYTAGKGAQGGAGIAIARRHGPEDAPPLQDRPRINIAFVVDKRPGAMHEAAVKNFWHNTKIQLLRAFARYRLLLGLQPDKCTILFPAVRTAPNALGCGGLLG